MLRPQLILPPPKTSSLADRDLALGIQSIWRCALFAAGAHVFCPHSAAEGELMSHRTRDLGRTLDGREVVGEVDALILSHIAGGPGRWTIGAGVVHLDDRGPLPSPVVVTGPMLDAMSEVLCPLAQMLGAELPADLHWTDLLRRDSGLPIEHDLRRLGRRAEPATIGVVA